VFGRLPSHSGEFLRRKSYSDLTSPARMGGPNLKAGGVLVRTPLHLTSQRTFPVRKDELDRTVKARLAHQPLNFLLGLQVI
jgi:hypothetical protein